MIKNTISQLLETEMERKEFLKLVGIGFVAAVGIMPILKALTQQTYRSARPSIPQDITPSLYGGAPKK